MRRLFRGLSIKQKLVLMIMATSIAVLLLASIGYILTDFFKSRADLQRDLTSQADLILKNSTAALEFRDPDAAQENLRTIAPNGHIRAACLYDGAGNLFSSYLAPSATIPCPSMPGQDGSHFAADRLLIVDSIDLQGRRSGTLLLRSDLELLRNRLKAQLLIVAILLAVTIGVAFLMSSRLHSIVSAPLASLSRTATEVSSSADYSVRADKTTDDELGVLVDAFNRMLEQIQLREGKLSAANEELRTEVTERRRAEQERAELLVREREANRLKDEFLATLSHELRTPLNAILGWTRLLRTSAIPPDGIDRALEKVERNAQVQARLVEDLLEVSRITTGKLHLEVKSLDLTTLAITAIESIRPTAEIRGIAIERQFQSSSLPTAGDPDRLQQVIWNLVSNAVKFTPPGGTVTISLRREGTTDELMVSDTGIGIDPAFLPDVFDTFRQADGTSTRAHGGLGLGLSIVRHIVELHGGEARAESAGINKGARFTVRLPVRTAERARDASSVRVVEKPGSFADVLAGTTVVVVDDDPDTRELLESVLRSAGAQVYLAENADAGFRICVEERPAVLISDIAMPGQDGYSLLRRLQKALGADRPKVAIALTAFAGPRDQQLALEAGFDRHVAKPFDADRLIAMVRDLLTPGAARVW